jgi:hypothetical protein
MRSNLVFPGGSNSAGLICHLNPVITAEANYHRHACSKKAFYL